MPAETPPASAKPRMPSVSQEGNTEAVLELLKAIGEGITGTVGEWCEVLIHDLRDLDHSIVHILGNVTGREVGGPMTDLGLTQIRSGHTEPLLNYTNYTDDGKTLRSSTMYVHDEDGKPIASICVNVNVTPLLLFSRFLRSTPAGQAEPDHSERFPADLPQMVETLIAECAAQIGKPVAHMTKGDRVRMVALLDQRGVFQLRKSVPLVAKRLGVTQKTVYTYLAELQAEQASPSPD
jgi:predicted transcriptional regulator YheO